MPKQKTAPVSVRANDIASAITQPKGPSRVSEDSIQVVRFNSKGRSDANSEHKFSEVEACAQQTNVGRNQIYKVKSRRGGKLFNPLVGGSNIAAVDKTSNNPMYQFREVNQQAFDAYVKFLKTGYDSYLLNAEREA